MNFHKQLTDHKHLEIVAKEDRKTHNYFCLDLSWTFKTDHAGFHFFLIVWYWQFEFNIYDHRHWNDEKQDWEVHSSEN